MSKLIIAAAAILLLALTALPQDVPAGPTTTPYGMAQYRLRLRSFSQTDTNSKSVSSLDYANQLGFQVGLKVKVNDAVFMQFQAGNDYISTEAMSWSTNNWGAVGHTKGVSPYFHLAYAKYDAKCVYVVAGIQPVASNGPLDLIERSMIADNYREAGLVTWVVGTNASMAGLKVGAPILKENFKLGVELFSSVTNNRSQTLVSTKTKTQVADVLSNPSAVMLLLDVPMSIAALTVTPQAVAILNRNYNEKTEKGDPEFGGGFAASYKIKDGFSVNACVGAANLTNKNSQGIVTTVIVKDTVQAGSNNLVRIQKNDTTKEYKQQGIIAGVGATYKVGPGNAIVDFKYSTDENTLLANSKSSYIYVDAKYGWDVNKNFSIMPRVRVFVKDIAAAAPPTGVVEKNTEIRPEIIFTGKF